MTFAYPWLLLLFIPFAGLVFFALKMRKPSIIIPTAKPFKKAGLAPANSLPFILFCTAVSLLILAASRPQKGIEELKQRTEGIDIILAIDLSGSMQAIDIPDRYKSGAEVRAGINSGKLRRRIDVSKEEIRKFIEKRPNDRIGLVAFAPLPYVACPPTLDHAWLYAHIDRLEPGVIGDSTGIAGPIASATHRLKSCESKRKVIVLFTDGKNNVNTKITPSQSAKLAKTFDIVIHTVGIGSKNAYVLQDGIFGKQFTPLQFEFDEKLLKEIAETTGGKYYAAADAEGLQKTMEEIDRIEKTTVEQPKYMDYRELAPSLIGISIVLLLAFFALESTLFLRIP